MLPVPRSQLNFLKQLRQALCVGAGVSKPGGLVGSSETRHRLAKTFIFDLSREEILKRVQAGSLKKLALDAHDYIYDIFQESERPAVGSGERKSP